MTFYRKKDTRQRRPIVGSLLLVVAAGLLFSELHSYIEEPLQRMGAAAVLVLLPAIAYQGWLWTPERMQRAYRYAREQHRIEQGRLTPKEAKQQGLLLKEKGLPLLSLAPKQDKRAEQMVGLNSGAVEGHLLVVGATRSGKGMHLTQTLLSSDAAMIVVDPKGEQYDRTAGYRAEHVGPVYRLPGNTVNLSDYYDLCNTDDVQELHYHLLTPWADKNPIFAEKCKFLFSAAGRYAAAHNLNPLLTLLDLATASPVASLNALRTVAENDVLNFTNGAEPAKMDKFAQSSWGTYSTRTFTYQQHWHTITSNAGLAAIPKEWAAQKATIYITYPFDVLKGVGAVVSAIIAALLRYQKLHDRHDPIIAAIDELPTVGLRNVEEYLSTVGGYSITMLLYVQSYSQLATLYGERGAETILSNCQHQLWYPPADEPTARRMSMLFGSDLEPMQSFSDGRKDKRFLPDMGDNLTSRSVNWQVRPTLTTEEMFALDKEQVIVRYDRRYVMKAYRLWPVPQFRKLPAPAWGVEETAACRPSAYWQLDPKEKIEEANSSKLIAEMTGDPGFTG